MWKIFQGIQLILILILTLISGCLGIVMMLVMRSPKWAMKLIPNYLWSPGIFWVFGVRLQVENVPKDLSSYIYAANHASPLDIPAMFMAMPVNAYFIAKMELKKIPIMGWFMTLAGMVFIDRGKREKAMESMQRAGREMQKGKSVIVFPEGTRSKDGKIKLFKRGAFILSKETGIPVIPALIQGAHKVMPPGVYSARPGKIRVRFFEAMQWEEEKYSSPEDFANHCQEIIRTQGSKELK